MKNIVKILKSDSRVVDIETCEFEENNLERDFPERGGIYMERARRVKISDVTYLSEDFKVKAYVIEPRVDEEYLSGIIIVNRGGYKDFGYLKPIDFIKHPLFRHLTERGYMVVAPQYRESPGSEGTDMYAGEDIEDILSIVSILLDSGVVVLHDLHMLGWSRGGLMTYGFLKHKKFPIRSAIIIASPTDLHKAAEYRPDMDELYRKLFLESDERERDTRSPVMWPREIDQRVPIMLIHGKEDKVSKPEETIVIGNQFEDIRRSYEMHIVEGANHDFLDKQSKEKLLSLIDTWLGKFK